MVTGNWNQRGVTLDKYKCNVVNRITYCEIPIMNFTHPAKLYTCHMITHNYLHVWLLSMYH